MGEIPASRLAWEVSPARLGSRIILPAWRAARARTRIICPARCTQPQWAIVAPPRASDASVARACQPAGARPPAEIGWLHRECENTLNFHGQN